jgi:hypothetical protein
MMGVAGRHRSLIAAAVAAVLIVALVAWVGGSTAKPPPASPGVVAPSGTAPSSLVPTGSPPTATPGPSVAVGPYRWTRLPSDGDLATSAPLQIIQRHDGGYLSVAFDQNARILSSRDGRSWTVEPADPGLLAAAPDHLSLVNRVVEGPHGFVAVGATVLDDFSTGDARAWISPDGVRWTAATTSDGMRDAEMNAVTVGPDGFVAVGSDGFPGASVQLPGARGAATWTSKDGSHWTRAPDHKSFAGAIMSGVMRIGAGFVAWGQVIAHPPGTTSAPVWTSRDGIHWLRASGIPITGGPGPAAPIEAVIETGDALVAVGSTEITGTAENGSVPAAWTSTDDGHTWQSAVIDPGASGDAVPDRMSDIAFVGPYAVAVGSSAAWRSTDQGRTWSRLPDDPSFAGALMTHIAPIDGGFVVLGRTDDSNGSAGSTLVWVAEPGG